MTHLPLLGVPMTDDKSVLDEKIDLGRIAIFLHSVFPDYSMQELVVKLSEFAPLERCTCTLCHKTRFPDCLGCMSE